ncbi:MAG: F0F1 ATP synthase subunit B [Rhodospirillales bacterium]
MFTDPTFWVAVAFVLFVGVLLYLKVPAKVAAALDSRSVKIRQEIDEAERLREEASDLLASYKAKQREAMKEADAIVAHAKEEAERMAKQGARKLEESIKRREQQAMDRLAQAEQQAIKQVRDQAAEIALTATEKLIVEQLDAKQSSALITAAIKDLPNRLN